MAPIKFMNKDCREWDQDKDLLDILLVDLHGNEYALTTAGGSELYGRCHNSPFCVILVAYSRKKKHKYKYKIRFLDKYSCNLFETCVFNTFSYEPWSSTSEGINPIKIKVYEVERI